MVLKRIKGLLRESRVVGELYVLFQRMVQRRNLRRLVVLPYAMYSGCSGDLRGSAVARVLRRRGWRTVIIPPWLNLKVRRRIIRSERPDVILIQQSVHPLNRPGLYEGVPCIFDADDAYIINTPEIVEECCRGSQAVVAGSRYMANRMSEFNSDMSIIWTGTYIRESGRKVPNEKRGPVIGWATSDLFSAVQEGEFVKEMLLRLARRATFSFWLYGATDVERAEEYVRPLREAGIEVKIFRILRYREFIDSMADVAIGLTPVCRNHAFFQGKSFGKVLAFMAADVAVIASNTIDHPLFFRHGDNGMLADENVDEWVECCAKLLANTEERGRMVARGRADFISRMTTERCAELLEPVLMRVIAGKRPASTSSVNRISLQAEPVEVQR